MNRVISFDATALPTEQLAPILAEYFALEEQRDVRREFLPQLAVVSLITSGLGIVGWITPAASAGTIAVLLGTPLLFWIRDWRRERRFISRLRQTSGIRVRY